MYRSQSPDTPEAVGRFHMDLLRAQPPVEKLQSVAAHNRLTLHLAGQGMRDLHPSASDEEIRWRVAAQWIPGDQLRRILPAELRCGMSDLLERASTEAGMP